MPRKTGCGLSSAEFFGSQENHCGALEILAEEGFQYDSSIFPVEHPSYGIPDAPRAPYWIDTASGRILEFPMPTLSIGSMRSPIGGGAYLRLLPYSYTRWSIRHLNERENFPVCVYIHPWELDPAQPRMGGSLSARARHYFGLRGTESKLRRKLVPGRRVLPASRSNQPAQPHRSRNVRLAYSDVKREGVTRVSV